MTTQTVIPCYPYVQFQDDANICAWFDAYNTYAQVYLDWFNNVPLFDYLNSGISGEFLDWVANGVYGVYRVPIAYSKSHTVGPLNTYTPNYITLNTKKTITDSQSQVMTDDILRRVITWDFYKADGLQFTIPWLKRRIARFLYGIDGFSDTNAISVTIVDKQVNIFLNIAPDIAPIAAALGSCIEQRIVNWPLGYTSQYNFLPTEGIRNDFGWDIS